MEKDEKLRKPNKRIRSRVDILRAKRTLTVSTGQLYHKVKTVEQGLNKLSRNNLRMESQCRCSPPWHWPLLGNYMTLGRPCPATYAVNLLDRRCSLKDLNIFSVNMKFHQNDLMTQIRYLSDVVPQVHVQSSKTKSIRLSSMQYEGPSLLTPFHLTRITIASAPLKVFFIIALQINYAIWTNEESVNSD